MDIFKAYEMSADAMQNGIWVTLTVGMTDIGRIKVRSIDPDINPEYRKALSVAALAKASDEKVDAEKISNAILAETVLTDWELYHTVKGKEVKLPFSREKAIELLTNLPKFRAAVERAAANWTNYRAVEFKETVKT